MCGLFSLLDTLLELPMAELMKQMRVISCASQPCEAVVRKNAPVSGQLLTSGNTLRRGGWRRRHRSAIHLC
jgi:c-di-GMP-related signal transduction protein